MATLDFSNYTALQNSIAKELNRTDLSDAIPGFIVLAEAEIARRVRRKTITRSIQIAAVSTPLPADCAELRSCRLVTGFPTLDLPLRNGTPEMLAEVRADYAIAGRPVAFTVTDGALVVAPAPDSAYTVELQYFERLASLSETTATNSVLLEAPDIYFYGALIHSAPYLEHDERLATWSGLFEKAVVQLDEAREREETNASIRPVRLPRVFS